MSGVLRRGSLNFNSDLNERMSSSPHGAARYNLNQGFYNGKPPHTPEINILTLDFRRLSQDLKKETSNINQSYLNPKQTVKDLSQDVDSDVISNFIGHYHRWQFIWTLVLSLLQIPSTFHMFGFVFQTAEKPFWCARTDDFMDTNVATWINLTQPNGPCSMFDVSDTNITNITKTCKKFEYFVDEGDAGSVTLVQEFDLVCSRRNLLSVVEMCFLAGAAVGSVSSGWLSDRFGRKHTLMVFLLTQAVFGTILAFSTSLAMFMTLRVIIGFASMTVVVVSFVLVVELVSGRWRTIIGILNILPVAIAYILAAGIAYYVRDWRYLQLVLTVPGWILLTMWYCVPESPRWLLARGRLDELYKIIERAARMNGIALPANYQKSLEAAVPIVPLMQHPSAHNDSIATTAPSRDPSMTATNIPSTTALTPNVDAGVSIIVGNNSYANNVHNIKNNSNNNNTTTTTDGNNIPDIEYNSNPLMVVFGKLYWSTTCLNLIVWLTLIIIYFGLTLHLSNLGGDIYVNTAIAGSAEAISICISLFVVLRVGIRWCLIGYMLIPGICCLVTNLVPTDDPVTIIALAMIAKCVIGANNAIIPTYTAMQYPTVVRNFGVGMGNLAAGIALILVPYMWLLEHIQPLLPMTIMGVCGIVGAIALMLMKDVK